MQVYRILSPVAAAFFLLSGTFASRAADAQHSETGQSVRGSPGGTGGVATQSDSGSPGISWSYSDSGSPGISWSYHPPEVTFLNHSDSGSPGISWSYHPPEITFPNPMPLTQSNRGSPDKSTGSLPTAGQSARGSPGKPASAERP
jgi:hypothetical protein